MIFCKMCKNLSKMVIESDEKGNIVKHKPNTCKVDNREIKDINSVCDLEGKC